MAESRSTPAALGIFIGPAIAYLSYAVFKSGLNEFIQLLFFGTYIWAGFDLASNRISLSGILCILFVPAVPFAMYLNQSTPPEGHQLTPMIIIMLWVGSALLGALISGSWRQTAGSSVARLVGIACGAMLVLFSSIWWSV